MTVPQQSHRVRAGGFSLIEVLAAVAVLAFVYIALSEYAMRGLGAEGEAQRRLHATTLADAKLAELEAQLLLDTPPAIGTQESDEDEFHIVIEVRAFSLELPVWAPKADAGNSPAATTADGPSFLRADEGDDAPPLRQIRVRIEWPEGRALQTVSRTTLFFDKTEHEELLSSLPVRLAKKGSKKTGDSESELTEDETEDELDAEFDSEPEQE